MKKVSQTDIIFKFRHLIYVRLVFEHLRFFKIFNLFFEDGYLLLFARLVNNLQTGYNFMLPRGHCWIVQVVFVVQYHRIHEVYRVTHDIALNHLATSVFIT